MTDKETKQLQEKAFDLFCQNVPQYEIAEIVDRDPSAISRWKDTHNWVERREVVEETGVDPGDELAVMLPEEPLPPEERKDLLIRIIDGLMEKAAENVPNIRFGNVYHYKTLAELMDIVNKNRRLEEGKPTEIRETRVLDVDKLEEKLRWHRQTEEDLEDV